jgi:hypothetical protein
MDQLFETDEYAPPGPSDQLFESDLSIPVLMDHTNYNVRIIVDRYIRSSVIRWDQQKSRIVKSSGFGEFG